MHILCSRFLVMVAFGLLPIWLGGLSGCDSKPEDGTLMEPPQIDADQKDRSQSPVSEANVGEAKKGLSERQGCSQETRELSSKACLAGRSVTEKSGVLERLITPSAVASIEMTARCPYLGVPALVQSENGSGTAFNDPAVKSG